MATVTVDQKALVLNAFAAQFQNNLIAKDLVDWHKYEGEMDDRNGLKVVEQVGPRYNITRTSSGVKDLSGGVQDSVFGSEQFTVQDVFGASMGWGDFVKIRDIGEARENVAIKNAAMNLAEQIDKYILGVASAAANNWTGTSPGAAVDSFTEFMAGYTRLKEEGVEDGDIRAALTYGDKQALGEAVINFNATDQLATGAFRGGFEGAIGGIPTMFTQQLPNHTNGTDVTGVTVDGAAQDVDYVDVAVSGAPGQYMTQLINLTGVTDTTGTVTAGSVFTIANVNAWDNRAQQSLGRLQQFVVVTGATAVANTDVQVRIFPAIIVQGSNDVNTAHATVDAAPADTAPVTFIGTAGQVLKPRLMIQKQAINVCTADLITPASGEARRQPLSKLPGSIRMWQDSTFSTGEHRIRFDIALTANVRDRRRIVKISGNT
jgi:hypothetical protein